MNKQTAISNAALAVFFILFCAYLLTFNGMSSTDDEQLYITLTEGMATGRGYTALPLLGNDRLQGNTGSVEPAHPFIGVPLYLLADRFNIGKAQILFILPIIYTALTGAILVIIANLQGYKQITSIYIGLAYGLGSIAFPYARMNFREPLAALAITSAALCFEFQKNKKLQPWKRVLFSCILFVALGFAALTKITTAVVIPIFMIAYLSQKRFWKKGSQIKQIKPLFLIAFLVLLAIASFTIFLPSDSLSRFTLRFANYIRYTLPRLPHDHFFQAIAGLLFSPGKGLFIYSPLLLLAFASPFIKDKKGNNWFLYGGSLLALLITQALIYNDDWWGITWGTRALLPILSLVMLASLPAISRNLNHQHRFFRYAIWIILILSIAIQGGRLAASDPAYVNWIVQYTGRSIDAAMQWNIFFSPIFRHWWLASRELVSDITWFHISNEKPMIIVLLIISAILCMTAAILAIIGKIHKKETLPVLLTCSLLLSASMLNLVNTDARYYSNVTIFKQAREDICEIVNEKDLILIDYYLDPFWLYYSNFGCKDPFWAGLPYIHNTAIQGNLFYPRFATTKQLIDSWLPNGDVYLISLSQNNEVSYVRELSEHNFQVSSFSSLDILPLQIYTIMK